MNASKPAQWGSLLLPPECLATMTAGDVDAIAHTAECETDAICFGISAIGYLLAVMAETGETLDADRLSDLGWLLESLGSLSAGLADVKRAAENELRRHHEAKRED